LAGHVEPNEEPADALKREFKEELELILHALIYLRPLNIMPGLEKQLMYVYSTSNGKASEGDGIQKHAQQFLKEAYGVLLKNEATPLILG
jgi:8-oxo-dGTP pyrophosphatase MutT (NUDIX family)